MITPFLNVVLTALLFTLLPVYVMYTLTISTCTLYECQRRSTVFCVSSALPVSNVILFTRLFSNISKILSTSTQIPYIVYIDSIPIN